MNPDISFLPFFREATEVETQTGPQQLKDCLQSGSSAMFGLKIFCFIYLLTVSRGASVPEQDELELLESMIMKIGEEPGRFKRAAGDRGAARGR